MKPNTFYAAIMVFILALCYLGGALYVETIHPEYTAVVLAFVGKSAGAMAGLIWLLKHFAEHGNGRPKNP